jgi:exonuclease VII large subunit
VSAPSQLPVPSHSDPIVAALIAQLQQQLDTQARQMQSAARELQYAQLKIQVLEQRLRLALIAKYGKHSEKLSDLQLELLELEPGVSSEEVRQRASASHSPRRPSRRRTRRDASPRASIPAGRACLLISNAWRRSLPARPRSAPAMAAVKTQP